MLDSLGELFADEGLNTTDQYEHEPILIKEIPMDTSQEVEQVAAYTFTVTKAAQSQPREETPHSQWSAGASSALPTGEPQEVDE